MATDYYSLLANAIRALDSNTSEARQGVYERARQIVERHLRSADPPMSQQSIKAERSALEDAIWQIEMASAGQRTTTGAPRSQQQHFDTRQPDYEQRTAWAGRRMVAVSGAVALIVVLVAVVGWLFLRPGANLNGLVVDNLGKPIVGVEVSIANAAFKTVTNNSGRYHIEYIPGRFEVRFEKGGYETASLTLEAATATNFPARDVTMDRQPFIQNADEALKKQDFDTAMNSLDQAIHLFPKEAATFLMRCQAWIGKMFKERGASDYRVQAIADCSSAIEIDPKDSKAFTLRASIWSLKQDVKRQIADLDKAIELDPKNVEALLRRADLFLREKNTDRALSMYEEVIRIVPTNWGGFLRRSVVWQVKGDTARADADLQEAKRAGSGNLHSSISGVSA